jgi:quercetin dioxygenase-like cupin family protein
MPIVKSSLAPLFEMPNLSVRGLAAPSRGSEQTCVWQLTPPPGTPGTRHSVDREEIFVVLDGQAHVEVDGAAAATLTAGDTLIVPPDRAFSLSNPGLQPFTAVAVLPVGGRATLPGGAPFSPPWTL